MRERRSRFALLGGGFLLCLSLACSTPGRLYVVAPAIAGTIRGSDLPIGEAKIERVVIHPENPTLFDRQTMGLFPDREFYFDLAQLAIAGHEQSKRYRVFLHLRSADADRVIWRTTLSRRAVAGLIQLDCDMDRPIEHGQPCLVDNPLQHPWLIGRGEQTFGRLCASCHGAGGAGTAPSSNGSPGAAPDLTRIASRRNGIFDRSEVAEWIEGRSVPAAHGARSMPVWGERLSREFERYVEGDELIGATLDPVLAYLESIQVSD